MNALLINPAVPNTFWSFAFALPFIRKKSAYPPLGLLTVAAMLPRAWSIRLVDINVELLADEDLEWADMVFIGGMVIQQRSARQVITRCKEKGVRVVAGGPLFTCEPDVFDDVDHLVLDEAEITLPAFLADLRDGCPQKIYRARGHCDLGLTPIPLWHLIRMEEYASMSIQFSRGCPFNCDFCNVTVLFGHKPRMKSARQVIAELDAIYDSGWRSSVFFVDDNFIGNKRYLKTELLPALIKWRKGKKGCVFSTEGSINLADDPELMRLLVKAGFHAVFIGIESPDEASLTECLKGQNQNRDLLESVRTIHRSGLQVQGGFIVGFDSDTQSTFQRQIEFIQQSGIVTAMVGLLQAPPGTRLFDRLNRENRLVGTFSGDNVEASTNIIPKMGLDTLLKGYRNIMRHIYSPPNFYRRIRTFLREFKAPEVHAPLDFQRFCAFFRSSVRLGIWGEERFQYWYLVFWTLIRRPRLLPLAITFSIYGHHFRKIYELHIR
ncbi:MAG TPA: B12-binding domain-containing radical SAM protein [Chondromyces sp.]|nr:B12-binding domain-containing radical SAM protein [Chondromyces sp.]